MQLRLAVRAVSLTVCVLLTEALLFNEERSDNAERHQVHQHSGPSRSLQRVSEYRPPQNRGIYHGDSTSKEQININAGGVGHSYHDESLSHGHEYSTPGDVGHSYHGDSPTHNKIHSSAGDVGHSNHGDASDHSSKKGRSYHDHNHIADKPGSAQQPHGATGGAHYLAHPTGPAPGAGGRDLEHQVKSIELLIRLASYLDVQGCFRRLVCESLFYGDRPTRRSDTETLVLRAFGLTPGSRDPGRWQTERFLLPAVAGWTARWGGRPDPCPSLAPSCSEPVVKRLREKAAAHSGGSAYTSGAAHGSGLH